MNSLPLVTSRRVWFVQDLAVWGLPSLGEHDYLLLENSTSGSSVFYGSAVLSEASQEVIFSDLFAQFHEFNPLLTHLFVIPACLFSTVVNLSLAQALKCLCITRNLWIKISDYSSK